MNLVDEYLEPKHNDTIKLLERGIFPRVHERLIAALWIYHNRDDEFERENEYGYAGRVEKGIRLFNKGSGHKWSITITEPEVISTTGPSVGIAIDYLPGNFIFNRGNDLIVQVRKL